MSTAKAATVKLLIGNIPPGTSDEDLREFVGRYGVTAVQSIQHVPGEADRPSAILEIAASAQALLAITRRMNGMQWKGRALHVQALTR